MNDTGEFCETAQVPDPYPPHEPWPEPPEVTSATHRTYVPETWPEMFTPVDCPPGPAPRRQRSHHAVCPGGWLPAGRYIDPDEETE